MNRRRQICSSATLAEKSCPPFLAIPIVICFQMVGKLNITKKKRLGDGVLIDYNIFAVWRRRAKKLIVMLNFKLNTVRDSWNFECHEAHWMCCRSIVCRISADGCLLNELSRPHTRVPVVYPLRLNSLWCVIPHAVFLSLKYVRFSTCIPINGQLYSFNRQSPTLK